MNTDVFIEQVRNRAQLASRGEAVTAVRAALETLAERLTAEEVKLIASRLPPEIASYLIPQAIPFNFNLEEFLSRIGIREGVDFSQAARTAGAVIATLQDAVANGEVDLRSLLPDDFASLFSVDREGRLKAA